MALTDLSRCSAASRHRGDPLAGSAPVASRWLLVEHLGPWSKHHLDTPPLLGRVGREVGEMCASFGGRVLLIRRPQRRGPEGEGRAWFAVDTVRGTWVRGTWRTVEDLLAAAGALGAELSRSDEDAEPMLLVCTQGTRDACCAVRGRPIVAQLAKEWPEETWECTHLGGHRFAGTMLSLPDGACLGYLDPDATVELVRDHLEGRVPAAHLRGVTRWEPAVQAALAAVLEAYGPAGVDDAVPGRVEATEEGAVVEVLGSGSVPDRVVVDVVVERLPEVPLSCGGAPKPHRAWRTSVRGAPEPSSNGVPSAPQHAGARHGGGVTSPTKGDPDMPDDLYDEELERRRVRDTALQAVVDDLVRRSEGRPLDEVRADLERSLAERDLPRMPDGWLDAVASAATIGDPYVVSSYAEHEDDVPPTQEHHGGYSVT